MSVAPPPGPAVPPSPEAVSFGVPPSGWRRRAFIVIFESDTRPGQLFDVALLVTIVASVLVVMLDSLAGLHAGHRRTFALAEWAFTALFTVEYVARLACVQRPLRYATSFFGIVDLLSVLPTYLAFLFPELQAFMDVRLLRLLRVFRILKLVAYVQEFRALGAALAASRRRLLVFLTAVALVIVLLGTVMYVVEGPENGFTSIPVAIYWAVTTMTTVGFGDITPRTGAGRAIASVVMLIGWGILAVPTGIVTAELTARRIRGEPHEAGRRCASCGAGGHGPGARFCHDCGARLDTPEEPR